ILALPEWSIRPQVFSLVFVALMAHLIVRDKLAWLPVLCVAWSNIHALVVLGVAIAGAILIEAVLWSRENLKRVTLVTVLCAAAPMVSPVGLNFWPQAFDSVAISKELGLQEYRSPFGIVDLPFWTALVVLIVLGVLR